MTTLGDAPGGAYLIASLADAVKSLSLLYAGSPDDTARVHLATFIDGIEPGIIKAVGPTKALIILNALRGAVMGRKHQIEALGSPARALS